MKGTCEVCGKLIEIMINRGEGICCENCRKVRDNDE